MTEAEVKQTLSRLGFAPSKMRGQNFLCDSAALASIIAFAGLSEGAKVVEIGPGLGALTHRLRATGHPVYAVELDRGFAQFLTQEWELDSDCRIVCQDARTINLELLCEELQISQLYVVSNVPYSISTELLLWALSQRKYIIQGCYLLQKEFAQRVAAEPGTKAYGSLSVLVQQYCSLALGPIISGSCFYPQASVESQVLRFTPLEQPREEIDDPAQFEAMVRSLFNQRRKTLRNTFSRFATPLPKHTCEAIFLAAAIDPQRRAESLSLAEFATLFRKWQEAL